MKKIILISILILMFMAPSGCFAASGSILSPWKKSGTNVSLARSTDNVGIGTAAPGGLLHLATPTIYLGQAIFEQASGDVDSFDLTFRKARGTIAAPTVITTADELGFINFAGYSGAAGYVTGAAIKAYSSGTVATTRVPANLRFYTGTDAAPTVLTERMRITNAGLVGINENSPDATLHITCPSSTTEGLHIQGAASQSVPYLRIKDSTDVAKVTVASTGVATFANDVYANGNLYTGGLDYGINPGVVNVFSSSVDPNSVITTAHGYKFPVDGAPTALFQRLSKGDGTTDTPSATLVGALNYGVSAVGTDAYAITLPLAPMAYTAGQMIIFKADVANIGACSLNANNIGAVALKAFHDQDPPDDYIEIGSIVIAVHDGTNFQIQTPDANP